jgi:hypothetical protein
MFLFYMARFPWVHEHAAIVEDVPLVNPVEHEERHFKYFINEKLQ